MQAILPGQDAKVVRTSGQLARSFVN